MKVNFRQQLLVSFGIIFGAVAAASIGLYILSGDVSAQAAKIVTDKTLIAQQTAVVSILAHLKNDAAHAAPYTAAMAELLPAHDGLIGFPDWVAGLAQARNVTVSVAFQGGGTPATAFVPASDDFSMTATGAAADMALFLNDLEVKAPGFLIAIDSFDLTNNGAQYSLSAHGKVFSR